MKREEYVRNAYTKALRTLNNNLNIKQNAKSKD